MTRLADRLGCTRPTAYTWVYQLDLAGVVGIQTKEKPMRLEKGPPEAQGRVSVTMKVDAALWKRLKIRAIEDDTTTGAIVEAALRPHLAAPRESKP